MQRAIRLLLAMSVLITSLAFALRSTPTNPPINLAIASQTTLIADNERSPGDLIFAPDESWFVTLNQTAGTASLVQVTMNSGNVVDEIEIGDTPCAGRPLPDGKTIICTIARTGELVWLNVSNGRLAIVGRLAIGCEPRDIAITSDGHTAFVALAAEDNVAVVNLQTKAVLGTIPVGRWPRTLCLSPDETRLAVACSGSRGIWMIDTVRRNVLFETTFKGLNFGQMVLAPNGREVWFPWTIYGQRETSVQSIQRGWVMASRLGSVSFENDQQTRGMSLDPPGNAVADGHGLAITSDGKRAVVVMGGSQELLLLLVQDIPWTSISGTDHMDEQLVNDPRRFARIPLGGRPLTVQLSRDGQRAFVTNYLKNMVQIVDLSDRRVVGEIEIGGPKSPTPARRGESLFYNARRSLENWYSCHTCHYNGDSNAETIDTFNDGSFGTYKTVPPLFNVAETGPWTWHGVQTDLRDLITQSFTTTMRGTSPTDRELDDMIAFLKTLRVPTNPYRSMDGRLSVTAQRGRALFNSTQIRCAECHAGALLTDGEIHDVGLNSKNDRYDGFDTPSLVNVQRKVLLLHDGRVRTLEQLLLGPHDPAQFDGGRPLTSQERGDLIEYLRTF